MPPPSDQTIMLIRHAEKPDGGHKGVSPKGEHDDHDLTVPGWRRAGALVRFFAPWPDADPPGQPPAPLCRPAKIFASNNEVGSRSARPAHTIRPLAKLIGIERLDTAWGDGQEDNLAQAAEAAAADGPVLIAWHHEKIPKICEALGVAAPDWPGDRFDMVWVLSRPSAGAPWAFRAAVPQRLLAGDGETAFPAP